MASLVISAEVLDEDVADASLFNNASLRSDEGVGLGHDDSSLDARLDDLASVGFEVLEHVAIGGHVVASLATEAIKDLANESAGRVATKVPQVGEAKVLPNSAK